MTTSNTQSREESSGLTKTSNRFDIVGEDVATGTAGRLGLVTAQQSPPLHPQFVSIDSLIDKEESSDDGRVGMAKARQELARQLSPALGETLKIHRLKAGLSQATLGRLVGTTQGHVARIESGKVDVQVGTLVRIAEALRVAPVDAFAAFVRVFGKND